MSEQQNTARDEGNWATPVDRLSVGNVPAGALDTVGGKQVVSPIQGFGKMWQKTYRVALTGAGAYRSRRRRDRYSAIHANARRLNQTGVKSP